jgi:hypothetical protein
MNDQCSIPGRSTGFFLQHHVQTCSGAHPASYPTGTGALSVGAKRLGCEADHTPPSSAEVKNAWSKVSIRPYVLIT